MFRGENFIYIHHIVTSGRLDWDTIASIIAIPIAVLALISISAFRQKRKVKGAIALTPIGPILALGLIAIFTLTAPPIEAEIGSSANLVVTPSPYVEEFSVPTLNSRPHAVEVDGEGRVWFVLNGVGSLAMFDPTTTRFREFNIPGLDAVESWKLELDEEGNLWFPDGRSDTLWRFDPELNSFSRYNVPTAGSFPVQVAPAKEAVWFTELTANKVARLSLREARLATALGITEFPVPTPNSGPAGILVDPQGWVWFTETYTDGKLAALDPATGAIKEYRLPKPLASPYGIVRDAQGNLWITEHGGSRVVKFNPEEGTMEEFYTTPTANYPITLPENIVIDHAGNIWFNEHAGNRIAKIDPTTGVLTEYNIPTGPLVNALDLAAAPDGNIWFTELSADKLGVVKANLPLPFSIRVDRAHVETARNSQFTVNLEVQSSEPIELTVASPAFNLHGGRVGLKTDDLPLTYEPKSPEPVKMAITFETTADIGAATYPIAIRASNPHVIQSVFITLTVKLG